MKWKRFPNIEPGRDTDILKWAIRGGTISRRSFGASWEHRVLWHLDSISERFPWKRVSSLKPAAWIQHACCRPRSFHHAARPRKVQFFSSLTPIGYIRTAAFLISRVDMKQIPLLHSDESSLIIVIVLISSYPKTNICPIDFFKNNSYSISARLHSTFNQSLTDLCYGFNTFWSMTNRGRVSYTAGVVFPRPSEGFNFIWRITLWPFTVPAGLAVSPAGHWCVSKCLRAMKDATQSPWKRASLDVQLCRCGLQVELLYGINTNLGCSVMVTLYFEVFLVPAETLETTVKKTLISHWCCSFSFEVMITGCRLAVLSHSH